MITMIESLLLLGSSGKPLGRGREGNRGTDLLYQGRLELLLRCFSAFQVGMVK